MSNRTVWWLLLTLLGPVADARDLKLATWNLEWLMEPRELRRLRLSCVPNNELPRGPGRTLPCDVANSKERSRADFSALARYARQLNADVVALQEVDGPVVARRLFADHNFCFSTRQHVQNLGFAIRRGLKYRCENDLRALSLGDTVRRGALLTLWPGEPNELRLLAVHLKSGCGRRPLDTGKTECAVLARQVPILETWIDAQAAAGLPFAVLGDFNRDLTRDPGPARTEAGALRSLWAEIDDADPPAADLTLAANYGAFRNCSVAQNFSGFIDHIVLSRDLKPLVVPGSFGRITYETQDAVLRRLSDHCPVAISLRFD
jgi:endonuclease/exonuclease/phosphatase family metal-dependent hydrolase